ncbi:lactate utilization protein [bacterium]|nr:lactate utilization protein [candidate division CSSED10-310 bacterium]
MSNRSSNLQSSYIHTLVEQVLSAFEWRRINGYFAPTRAAALTRVMELIPAGSTVSQGGSVTLDETGVREALKMRSDITFLDPYDPALPREKQIQVRRQGMISDVFISGTNAITRDGILVNRDGMGNRVAAIAFGPSRVIIVAGINKIVPDVDSAVMRIDDIAAPMNCMRLNKKTPCRESLRCTDCADDDRICCVTTIIERQTVPDRMHVILVGETLGF